MTDNKFKYIKNRKCLIRYSIYFNTDVAWWFVPEKFKDNIAIGSTFYCDGSLMHKNEMYPMDDLILLDLRDSKLGKLYYKLED
jgi:hypothetical protein